MNNNEHIISQELGLDMKLIYDKEQHSFSLLYTGGENPIRIYKDTAKTYEKAIEKAHDYFFALSAKTNDILADCIWERL